MTNVFTNPTYRTPRVGDSRGDFSCPPDQLTIDEIVCELEDAGLDPEVDDDRIEVDTLVVYMDDHGWAYRVTHRYGVESGWVDDLADLRILAATIAANP